MADVVAYHAWLSPDVHVQLHILETGNEGKSHDLTHSQAGNHIHKAGHFSVKNPGQISVKVKILIAGVLVFGAREGPKKKT